MKTKFNIVGNTFTHLTGGNKGYSTHGKISQHIEWVRSGGEATFYIDHAINQGLQDKSDLPKYLWLLESQYIMPGLVEYILQNRELIETTYDIIFTHNQRLLELGDKYKWVPANGFWIQTPKIYDKNMMVSMVSSNKKMCPGHIERLQWVEKLRDKVDLYGRGFNEIKYKEEALCNYMFSVAIENGQYETYFTEKLLDCFATGTIPVYLGAPDINDHFNGNGIIPLIENLDLSEDLYYSRRDAIEDNLERSKAMEVTEDFIWENYFK